MDQPTTGIKRMPLEFTGTTREYFGIWIVNVLLTVVTLGVYGAWAKVRNKRYLYGNTLLDKAPFDYLANPLAILKGWLIALVFFFLYSVISHFTPFAAPVFGIMFLVLTPWVVINALSFRMRNTAYRNIRFGFEKNYKEAVSVFILLPILIPFTLGLIVPYYLYRQKKFIVDHSSYGKSTFSIGAGAGGFYKIYLIAIGAFIGAGIIASIIGGGIAGFMFASRGMPTPTEISSQAVLPKLSYDRFLSDVRNDSVLMVHMDNNATLVVKKDGQSYMAPVVNDPALIDELMDHNVKIDIKDSSGDPLSSSPPQMPQMGAMTFMMTLVTMLPMFIIYLLVFGYIQAATTNYIWNNTMVGEHGFECTLAVKKMAWIYFSNVVMIMLSLGLLIPWARIRMLRYRIENLTLVANGSLDEVVQQEQRYVSAMGEEMGEVFDIDIGL